MIEAPRKTPVLYRRHIKGCQGKSRDIRCHCPIWIDFKAGERVRKSLGTSDWELAQQRAHLEYNVEVTYAGMPRTVDEILVAKAILTVNECRSQEDGQRVYLVAAGGSLKIGVTSNVARRIAELQTGHASLLSLRRQFKGGVELERALHLLFIEFARSGEWFRVNPTLSAFIERSASLDCEGR